METNFIMKKKDKLLVIAEIGVNHNGSLALAKKLVLIAKYAKADYVKFQTFEAKNLVTFRAKSAPYQVKNLKKNYKQIDFLKKLELNKEKHIKLLKFCKKINMKFLSSPFDIESAKLLKSIGLKEIKIPSGEINNYPLLEETAKFAKKIFLSTGMSNLREVGHALNIFYKNKISKKNIFLLHCVSSYPAPLNELNLLSMKTMENKFKVKVGFSDHTLGSEASMCAVTIGAKVIEKHITTNSKLHGPDHKASMNPDDFKFFVKKLRNIKDILGNGVKKITKSETFTKKLVRKSIVAKIEIKKGEIFDISNITCKRPEGGISPIFWKSIIGKKSKYFFKPDDFIKI